MITKPNTLGIFEPRIVEIGELCHASGAQVYMDGANLNAILGITRPGDLGFDVCTSTCTRPSRRRTAAAGPARARSASRRTSSRSCRCRSSPSDDDALRARLEAAAVDRQAAGLLGQLRHARARLHLHPHAGRRRPARGVSENAVLNANYVLKRLERPLRRRRARPVHARVRALGAAPEEARRDARSTSPSACSTRLPRAHDLLPADRRGGADDRADRDRVEGDARRLLRRDDPDRAGGGDRSRTPSTRRRSPRRCAASTRPRPRASRISAGCAPRRAAPCDAGP